MRKQLYSLTKLKIFDVYLSGSSLLGFILKKIIILLTFNIKNEQFKTLLLLFVTTHY